MTQLCLLGLSGSPHRASKGPRCFAAFRTRVCAQIPDYFHKAVGYVDKILKGANPADLPVAHAI